MSGTLQCWLQLVFSGEVLLVFSFKRLEHNTTPPHLHWLKVPERIQSFVYVFWLTAACMPVRCHTWLSLLTRCRPLNHAIVSIPDHCQNIWVIRAFMLFMAFLTSRTSCYWKCATLLFVQLPCSIFMIVSLNYACIMIIIIIRRRIVIIRVILILIIIDT